jgi:hypothetical protein
MNHGQDAREVLRRLRWLERAEALLRELSHPEVPDPDIDAVARALAVQVELERQMLRSGHARSQPHC